MKLFKIPLLLLSIIFLLASCKIFQVPVASQIGIDAKTQVRAATAALYAHIENSADRSYGPFAPEYASINVQLNNIASFDSTRTNSATLLKLDWIAINRFRRYEQDHKDKSFNKTQAVLDGQEMDAALAPPYNSEMNYKKLK